MCRVRRTAFKHQAVVNKSWGLWDAKLSVYVIRRKPMRLKVSVVNSLSRSQNINGLYRRFSWIGVVSDIPLGRLVRRKMWSIWQLHGVRQHCTSSFWTTRPMESCQIPMPQQNKTMSDDRNLPWSRCWGQNKIIHKKLATLHLNNDRDRISELWGEANAEWHQRVGQRKRWQTVQPSLIR